MRSINFLLTYLLFSCSLAAFKHVVRAVCDGDVGVTGAPAIGRHHVSTGRTGDGQAQLPGDRRVSHQDAGGRLHRKCVRIYTVSQKVPTFKLSVTLSSLNLFSKCLHCLDAYEIWYAHIQQIWEKMQTMCTLIWHMLPWAHSSPYPKRHLDRLHSSRQSVPILYNGHPFPLKMALSRGLGSGPHLIQVPWAHLSAQPKRHLDRFNRFNHFCRLKIVTDRLTDRPRHSVCNCSNSSCAYRPSFVKKVAAQCDKLRRRSSVECWEHLRRFWDIARYWSKIADSNLAHMYLSSPLGWPHWNFA